MIRDLPSIEAHAASALAERGLPDAAEIAWACAWLEACGYPGLKMLAEALADERHALQLTRDALGLDLDQVSCAFLAPAIMRLTEQEGRIFLRNVRHGLYMLPFAVRANAGIGCPVDPAFAVGGTRTKNPYGEKLAAAAANGVEVDEAVWASLR